MDELKTAHWSVMDETPAKGIFQGAEPLHPNATAIAVRIMAASLWSEGKC